MIIQTNVPEEINRALKLHKARYGFGTLQDALLDILERYFKDNEGEYFLETNEKLKKTGSSELVKDKHTKYEVKI